MDLFRKQKEFITRLENEILFEQFKRTLEQYDFIITDYITEKQLFEKGIDGNEKKLAGYSRTTIRIKRRKGQPIDRTTLRDEKEFHPSIMVDAKQDGFEITSDVTHAKFLIKRYGKNILKVTNDNMKEFMTTYFLPNVKNAIQ